MSHGWPTRRHRLLSLAPLRRVASRPDLGDNGSGRREDRVAHCSRMMRALEGTPSPFTRKSMYGPGGAVVRLVGTAIESPPAAPEKPRGTSSWLISKACVTDPSRMKVTFVMLAASGVSTNTVWP